MGGGMHAPVDGDDLDEWLRDCVVAGGYLSDESWLTRIWESLPRVIADYEAWGVRFSRDERGDIRRFASRGMRAVRCLEFNPRAALKGLRARAETLDRNSVVSGKSGTERVDLGGGRIIKKKKQK